MSDDHRPTSLWIDGQIRILNTQAIPVYVRNKGGHADWIIMIKVAVPRKSGAYAAII